MASEEYKFFNKRKTSSNVGKQQLETDNAIQVSRSILRGLRYVTNEKNETNQEMEHEIDYEDEWINKLAVIDDEHSRKNGLNERNIEKLLQSLTSKYAHMKPERYCSSQADRIIQDSKQSIVKYYYTSSHELFKKKFYECNK
nr:uncharacterized protein LOC116424213 isoform X2 [Nomia melanderi]